MYKIIVCIGLLGIAAPAYSIILGPNLTANSPAEYLVDLQHYINAPEVTHQIGTELYNRTYSASASIGDVIVASFDATPPGPGSGYTPDKGRWAWTADAPHASTGAWLWILRTVSYYVSKFHSNV
jgi:hypothetical protein